MSQAEDGDSRAPRRRRRVKWAAAVIVGLMVVVTGGFVLWATSTPKPGPRADEAIESDDLVRVIDSAGYTFEPLQPARVGFILYPGGRVDPASYAAPARAIAEEGFLVVVPELTLNLAVLDANAADDVIAAHPQIDQWAIGGHSLGGTLAARYAGEHRDTIAGLVLWAAYPANRTDLSTAATIVTSIFGTRDGLTTPDNIDDSRARLPPHTEFVAIQGGNHAQFGDYGSQPGDSPADIGRADQQAQTVEATLRVLRAL